METPSVWTRLRARAQGELPADTLEAYRRASLTVLELIERTEARRTQARLESLTAWTLPPGTQIEMLCAWNAFVLQSLGTEFLDADYHDEPGTAGFVPPITADQVMAFFTPVSGWLGRARQAGSDPNYKLDVPVPAPVPQWSEIEPCPNTHLHGMLSAMRSIRQHAQLAVDFLGETPPQQEAGARQYHAIRGLFANASAKAQYSDDLHGSNPTQAVHELVEPSIKEAIESFHRVGQFVAMPALVDTTATMSRPPAPPVITTWRPRLPGEPGFDPWCLTDPDARDRLGRDPEARQAIERLWQLDPDPSATLALRTEIQAAEDSGRISRAIGASGRPLGHFFCCPWGTVYEVARPVVIGGESLRQNEQFVLDVTAEGVELGYPFKRGLKRGDFRPTDEFEYGDPSEQPDH